MIPMHWKVWIRDSITAGCDKDASMKVLVDAGFTNEEIVTAVEEIEKEIAAGIKNAYGFDYNLNVGRFEDVVTRVRHAAGRTSLSMIGHCPAFIVVDDAFTGEECEALRNASAPSLMPSLAVDTRSGKNIEYSGRTSWQTFHSRNSPASGLFDTRLSDLFGHPVNRGEHLQVLRYERGQQYVPHYDFFDPSLDGVQMHASHGQRCATCIVYLSDVYMGGYTHFPVPNVFIKPKIGRVLYFEYLDSNGQLDKNSLHAGLPVEYGTKWIATKWFRDMDQS